MKKVVLLILTMFCLSVYSQEKGGQFTVLKIGNKYSKVAIQEAFAKANLCGNFYLSKANDITLDDGSIVRFLSKAEQGTGSDLSNDCFVSDDFRFEKVVWSILPNGTIAKGHALRPNKSHTKE